MRILLVEDSMRLQRSLGVGLRREGYAVDVAGDGERGLLYALHNPYDVIILDLMLPKIDGLQVLDRLRQEKTPSQVLILTAKDAVEDRVRGLRSGADDYLVKPFAFDELLARIEALTRRLYDSKSSVIRVGDLEIDTVARTAHRAGRALELTRREYLLLEYLAYRLGEVVRRTEIEDHLYGERNFPMSNAVDRTVCALRKKIDPPEAPRLIHTRRGLGYVLTATAS